MKRESGARCTGTAAKNIFGNGWRTTDEDEIARRRERARSERLTVRRLPEPAAAYAVTSREGRTYRVEIRSSSEPLNSCDCPDFETNGLGTCKHIEAALRHPGAADTPLTEVFLDRRRQYDEGPRVRVAWAPRLRAESRVRTLLGPFFSASGALLGDPVAAVPELTRALEQARLPAGTVRLSAHIAPFIERLRRERERIAARSHFLSQVAAGKRKLEVVKFPLYDYQREGMLHLAFKERALLGDEMGLGKTVQAVAACELLRQLRGVERVLVVTPVSLKTEWEEQIRKFTDSGLCIIQGSRPERQRLYRSGSFYFLANYEQVLTDGADLQGLLAPDIIVLDEAQRIKNWQSKTADAIKRLRSRYVFVLTGTPLENRIDDIYSLAQVMDPHLFGPLFRFNREFYELDEKGRPEGYKNLEELHRRLRPVLLRRRKQEVEGELPARTVNTYFVEMAPEQRAWYQEYEAKVARLVQAARRRPLSPDEFKRLQSHLACMRMVCDSPYILDGESRIAPKLTELKAILEEQLTPEDNKIILFSEWTRMLELVREHLDASGIGYALHTGEVPQQRRRAEINRFKEDRACRIFLSSDAGATGLNLQAANVVINLDLPWNPARLEQRIARAWRKHQRRVVNVIHLVCADSIEHRMLHLLEQKRALASGILDGGSGDRMALPSGRRMLIEQLSELMAQPPKAASEAPVVSAPRNAEELPKSIDAALPGTLTQLELFDHPDTGGATLLAVVKDDAPAQRERIGSLAAQLQTPPAAVEVIDESTLALLRRLVDSGVVTLRDPSRTLRPSPESALARRARIPEARARLAGIERPLRLARLLHSGGFAAEAAGPLREALTHALDALAHAQGTASETAWRSVIAGQPGSATLEPAATSLLAALRAGGDADARGCEAVAALVSEIGRLFEEWSKE